MRNTEILDELESTFHLGRPAKIVNRALTIVFSVLTVPMVPMGCLLGFVHGAFMIVTLGLYALVWTVVWLPLLAMALATSWLWSKASWMWPLWLLVALPFLLLGYLVASLGPQDVGGEDKISKVTLLWMWPYTWCAMRQEMSQPVPE
jgi:hypothetical protein